MKSTELNLRILTFGIILQAIHNACLSNGFYQSMNMTQLVTPATGNFTMCIKIYSQFGSCVNQTDLIGRISKEQFDKSRSFVKNSGGLISVINNLQQRVDGMLKNYKKINDNPAYQNTTIQTSGRLLQVQQQPPNNTTNQTNLTLNNGSSNNPPKPVNLPNKPPEVSDDQKANKTLVNTSSKANVKVKNPKNMAISNATTQALLNLQANLTTFKDYIEKMKSPKARGECYKSIFSVDAGVFCTITSGAATTYTTSDGNGGISGINVPQTAAANITATCLPFIWDLCIVRQFYQAFLTLMNNSTSPGSDPGLSALCASLVAAPSCVQNPLSCPASIQTALMQAAVKPFGSFLTLDFNLQDVSDIMNSADASGNATLTANNLQPTRLLQTQSGISYTVTSNSNDVLAEADQSGLPTASVENSISSEIPAVMNSSVQLIKTIGVIAAIFTFIF